MKFILFNLFAAFAVGSGSGLRANKAVELRQLQDVPADVVQEMPSDVVQEEMPVDVVQEEMPVDTVQEEMPGDKVQEEFPADTLQEVPADTPEQDQEELCFGVSPVDLIPCLIGTICGEIKIPLPICKSGGAGLLDGLELPEPNVGPLIECMSGAMSVVPPDFMAMQGCLQEVPAAMGLDDELAEAFAQIPVV